MSIRFSRVKAVSENKTSIFLVGGVPASPADLKGWVAFREFSDGLRKNEQITICAETFIYGGDEPFDATPEEVAYIYMRIDKRPDFIEARATKIADSEFTMRHN